jgi:hypothetical protein
LRKSWIRIAITRKLLIVALLTGSISEWQYVGRWVSTPPFRDASRTIVSGAVAQMQRVRLGDVRRIFAAQFCRLVFANLNHNSVSVSS